MQYIYFFVFSAYSLILVMSDIQWLEGNVVSLNKGVGVFVYTHIRSLVCPLIVSYKEFSRGIYTGGIGSV